MNENKDNTQKAKEFFIQSLEFQKNGQLIKAIETLETALIFCPTRESIINNLIILYFSINKKEKLITLLKKIDQNILKNVYQKGLCYLEYLNQNYQKCINLITQNENKEIYLNLQLLDLAIKCFFQTKDIKNVFVYSRKLLKGQDSYDQRLFAVGHILLCLSKPRAAKKYIKKSLDINFNQSYAFDLGFCYLQLKDFQNGFKFWNNRFDGHNENLKLFSNIPTITNIDDIHNKNIVVWFEQGLGDTINFCRYIRLLKKHTPNITFVVQKSLLKFFKNFETEIKVSIYEDINHENYDFQISLISIISLFKLSYNQIPLQNQIILNKLKKIKNIKKVGFAHSGNTKYFRDTYRSISSSIFKKLFNIKSIEYYKLNNQFEPYVDEYNNVNDLGILSIDEIANKLPEFDLVITTDTFLVHLCGYLNINCILLLNYNSDWRWFSDKKYTKWYQSVRILKQKSILSWDYEIRTLMRFLKKKLR